MDVALCFAILAHEDRDSLGDLLQNVAHFCPGSTPIVYDASKSGGLCKGLPTLAIPGSRPLPYGYGTRYIFDVMEWALSMQLQFDLFVVLDSDLLFVQEGYEEFLERHLGSSEYMGIRFTPEPRTNSIESPAAFMWRNWKRWRHLLDASLPCTAFNPLQAFRRSLVERIVALPNLNRLRRAVNQTRRKAMAEAVFPTLAHALDGRPQAYPNPYPFSVSYRPGSTVSLYEAVRFAHTPDCHVVHPVKPLNVDHPVRLWVRWNAGYGTV